MTRWNRRHLSDDAVLSGADTRFENSHANLADMLADIGEVDARRLYARAGHPSLFAWCTARRRLSDDEAYNRIDAARKARQFPAIFPMVADGRLSLTAVVKLGPRLTAENCDELLAAAADRSKTEIEELLAARFPRTEMLPMVITMPPAPALTTTPMPAVSFAGDEQVPEPVRTYVRPVTPTAAGRHLFQFMGDDELRDLLRDVQDMLGDRAPEGGMGAVVKVALKMYKAKLEKEKYALTDRPRAPRRQSDSNPRHIPAYVRRAVRLRDGDRCSFVGDQGHRCGSRRHLEFDHILPVARGGESTVDNVRLRCRAHNQYEAERVFGAEFMAAKRADGRSRAG